MLVHRLQYLVLILLTLVAWAGEVTFSLQEALEALEEAEMVQDPQQQHKMAQQTQAAEAAEDSTQVANQTGLVGQEDLALL